MIEISKLNAFYSFCMGPIDCYYDGPRFIYKEKYLVI